VGFRGVASRGDWPCYAAVLDHLWPRADGRPSGVCLPLVLRNGPNAISGTHAGFLGPKHDPIQVDHDPNARDFRVDGLSLPSDVLHERFDARRSLLDRVENRGGGSSRTGTNDEYRAYRQRAVDMLAGGELAKAFAIDREADDVRARYGRN